MQARAKCDKGEVLHIPDGNLKLHTIRVKHSDKHKQSAL